MSRLLHRLVPGALLALAAFAAVAGGQQPQQTFVIGADAQFVSQGVPATMVVGQSYPVSVMMYNNSSSQEYDWSDSALGAQNPANNTTWGVSQVGVGTSVQPGSDHSFNFTVTAPTTPGTYNFQWRMRVSGSSLWFGQLTPNVAVVVTANQLPTVGLTAPTNGASYTTGQTVAMSATASDADGSIDRVEFFVDGVEVAQDTTNPYSGAWTAMAGSHTLKARAWDNHNGYKDSASRTITVSQPAPPPVSITRTYRYNSFQELCAVDEPETGTTLMGYDAAGNLSWSASGLAGEPACSATGNTTAILARKAARTYDVRNRVSTLTFPDNNGNQSWSYTPDGLPDTVTTWNGGGANSAVNSYVYNKRRLLTSESSGQTGWYTWWVHHSFNANGHRTRLTLPDGVFIDYAPNALGLPTQAGSYATGVQYYPNGAIKQFTYGNGIVHTMTPNARGLPDRSRDAYGTTSIHDDSYDYDANGNVVAISDGVAGFRGDRDMVYDDLDRLVVATSPMFGTATYAYDAIDNLTHVQVTGGSQPRNHDYCYDQYNRLTNVMAGGCSGGTSVIGLGYDVQGNLANKNGVNYTFDYDNRLRSAGPEVYRYDVAGRRVLGWTQAEGNILSVYGQDGVLGFQYNQRRNRYLDYVYLGGSLVATRANDLSTGVITVTYQHTDALGSPVAVTDANRTVLQRSEYEPYGFLTSGPMEDGPGYTGHVTDAATGLVYMQQRYYDPGIGRFDSVDPVTAYDNGDMRFFNRYAYAFNNPYKFNDPDGRCPTCAVGAGIGALVGGGIELYKQTGGFKNWNNLDGGAIAVETGRGALIGALAGAGAFGAGALATSAGATATGVATAEVVGGAYATGVGTFVTGPASDLAKGTPEKTTAAYGKEAVNAGVGALAGGVAGKAAGAISATLARSNAASVAGGVAARALEEGTSVTVSSSLSNSQPPKKPDQKIE